MKFANSFNYNLFFFVLKKSLRELKKKKKKKGIDFSLISAECDHVYELIRECQTLPQLLCIYTITNQSINECITIEFELLGA